MIEELKIMRGPNMWSPKHHRLIVLKLQGELPAEATITGLESGLLGLFPSLDGRLRELRQSAGQERSLFLAGLLALTGLELQATGYPHLSFHRAEKLGKASFYALFEYEDEEHGREAAYSAVSLLEALLRGETPDPKADLEKLGDIVAWNSPGPSSKAILDEARKRGIPLTKLAEGRLLGLGYGRHQRRIAAALTDGTGWMAVDIAGDKALTKLLLREAMLPVPRGAVISREAELEQVAGRLGFPLVTKPLDGHQGKCITTDITKFETLLEGFRLARGYSRKVIVEKYLQGSDYRLLVVNYKLVAAARRSPALVTGNGRSTIRELIDEVNADPRRGRGHGSVLTRIEVDSITEQLLKAAGRSLGTVLPEGAVQVLKDTANLSTGGTAEDVTDQVHPDNVRLAERAARAVGLDICGIDVMSPDIAVPLADNGGAIIEVNAAPGLRMHVAPSSGSPRPVGQAIVDMMFPGQRDGRIPLVAVTGTNGKTTVSRLMAHMAQEQGFCAGLTTTEGIYIGGSQVVSGDCSGPYSAGVVLQDPTVDFAVLECARGGILRSGLAFDACDVGIVTNVAADHLGLKDIDTVEDMARVKQVVAQAVKPGGYAILNASIDLVRLMASGLSCNVALFCLDPDNEHVVRHCEKGGLAAVRDKDGNVVILDGKERIVVEQASRIPITMEGKAGFMTENVLPVVLAAYVLKFPVEGIRSALAGFSLTEEQAPGRLNIIPVGARKIIVDYAHNPHGLRAFGEFLANISEHKTGIITGVGDRRDQDIAELGRLAADMYDEVIIRIDEDTRGRAPDEIVRLIREGLQGRRPDLPCRVIPGMKEALLDALRHSPEGGYIVLNPDSVQKTLKIIKEIKEQYKKEERN